LQGFFFESEFFLARIGRVSTALLRQTKAIPLMSTLESLASGCLLALASLIVIGVAIMLFSKAFERPETNGTFAIAGVILVGSGIIAVAIGISKGGGSV
jgi:hypothetical protein